MVKFLCRVSAPFARMGRHVQRTDSGAGRCGLQLAQGQRGVHTLLFFR